MADNDPTIPLSPAEIQRMNQRRYARTYRERHPEAFRASQYAYRQRNLEMRRAQSRDYCRANKERRAVYTKQWAADHAEERRAYNREYGQTHKVEKKLYNQEHSATHRAQLNARHRRWCREHPEHIRAKAARRRACKAAAPINDLTREQWQMIKEHYGFRCVYCGQKMQRLTQDHITPLSQGGSHTLSNVVPACKSCNSRKRTGPPLKPVQPLLL